VASDSWFVQRARRASEESQKPEGRGGGAGGGTILQGAGFHLVLLGSNLNCSVVGIGVECFHAFWARMPSDGCVAIGGQNDVGGIFQKSSRPSPEASLLCNAVGPLFLVILSS
jgi:hypothetical protein